MKLTILIATKNRVDDLLVTLNKIKPLFNENLNCVVFDDGSTDSTYDKVHALFPEVQLLRNNVSKGYMFCRNKMLNETNADFAISLDDDAHFLSENPIPLIVDYFNNNSNCGVIAMRILWNKKEAKNLLSDDAVEQVKSFVGCGHVWRIKAWRDIPNYPEWFEFYGEENFASFQLIKKQWETHYVPSILVQHRVSLKERAKNASQFKFRYRRSMRADWYNYLLFLPLNKIPRCIGYSFWYQCKAKIFKGDSKVILPLFMVILDAMIAIPKIIKHRNALTVEEYTTYLKLSEAKIFWKPEK